MNGKSTIFRACHNPNLAPCRDSAMASSKYHSRCQCGLNELPSGRRCGRTRRAEVGVPGGSGVRTGWCQMRPEPQPRAPRPLHGSCECSRPVSGPPAVGMGRRGGPRWVSRVGGASEPGGTKCCWSPNQGPPDLSMGRVIAAGPSPGPRPSVWADAEGRGGCPGCYGNQFTSEHLQIDLDKGLQCILHSFIDAPRPEARGQLACRNLWWNIFYPS